MTTNKEKSELTGLSEEEGDVRVWSGACQRSEYADESDKYMCLSFGKIEGLNHEVHHEIFPHISGDEDNLS